MARCTSCGGGGPAPEMRPITQTYAKGGFFMLAQYPDCTQLYQGRHEGDSVFIVARGTPSEKLFKRSQLIEASDYSHTKRHSVMEAAATAEICHQAVVDLLGV